MLVAGVGTVGRGDDGFGIEVVRRLADEVLPVWVQLAEHGIGCGRLGRELLGGYDTTVLLGATATGAVPGRLRVTETDLGDLGPDDGPALPAPRGRGARRSPTSCRPVSGRERHTHCCGCSAATRDGWSWWAASPRARPASG